MLKVNNGLKVRAFGVRDSASVNIARRKWSESMTRCRIHTHIGFDGQLVWHAMPDKCD